MIGRNAPHGFVWPDGLPGCAVCERPANDPIHVTPARGGIGPAMLGLSQVAEEKGVAHLPSRSHAYAMRSGAGVLKRIPCALCGGTLEDSRHPVGAPSGMQIKGGMPRMEPPTLAMSAKERQAKPTLPGEGDRFPIGSKADLRNAIQAFGRAKPEDRDRVKRWIMRRARELNAEGMLPQAWRERAFVAEVGNRLVLAGRGDLGVVDDLPGRVGQVYRERAGESGHLWISGRYVEADAANRNAAYWSTDDLELGEPSVAHGPINWLHEERHIIGAIAATEMVRVDREAASDGVGNHIVALGAVWPYIYGTEAKLIEQASERGSLWYSMECVSRTVACLADDCGNEPSYKAYMTEKATARCDHMQEGGARRFVDPVFLGAGIIVPPVRPGWAKADARVLMPQAAALAERQAAAFEGLETSEAELLVAQLVASVA